MADGEGVDVRSDQYGVERMQEKRKKNNGRILYLFCEWCVLLLVS